MTSDTLAIAHKVANHPAFNRLAVGLRIARGQSALGVRRRTRAPAPRGEHAKSGGRSMSQWHGDNQGNGLASRDARSQKRCKPSIYDRASRDARARVTRRTVTKTVSPNA